MSNVESKNVSSSYLFEQELRLHRMKANERMFSEKFESITQHSASKFSHLYLNHPIVF